MRLTAPAGLEVGAEEREAGALDDPLAELELRPPSAPTLRALAERLCAAAAGGQGEEGSLAGLARGLVLAIQAGQRCRSAASPLLELRTPQLAVQPFQDAPAERRRSQAPELDESAGVGPAGQEGRREG